MPLVKEVLRDAVRDFNRAGVDTARLDAEVLLLHVLGVDRARLLLMNDSPLNETQYSQFMEMCQRRLKREPVAYIVGNREFYGLEFQVDSRVLVPRPETELLVDMALYYLLPGQRLLDVCTGSGAVAIAIKHQRPDVVVTASDISAPALDCARRNMFNLLDDVEAIELVQSDLFERFTGKRFHLITANPPYISDEERVHLAPELDFEPQLALVAENEGLAIITRLISDAQKYLIPGGRLLMEIGCFQDGRVLDLARAAGYEAKMYLDYSGLPRMIECHL